MFSDAKLQSIIWTSQVPVAERFYSGVLGLSLRARSDGALVYNVGGSDLRVAPVPSTEPSAHTVMGFAVADVDAAIAYLADHGVAIERFTGMPHSDNGSVT
ncbi:MAG TPA: VOC family protein, partial [Gammaproteobacteria bacterium]|nr:VOC family protein [Gammaproteobacteria bacterium]